MVEATDKMPFADRVANKIIEQLAAGTAPWQKPWDAAAVISGLPMNPVSEKRYKGINSMWLLCQQPGDDSRWCTYKQAEAQGWQVRRGEKGTTVEFWQWDKEEKGPDGQKRTVRMDRPKVFWASVFHASQIDGMPEHVVPVQKWDPITRVDSLIKASGAWVEHRAGDSAFYSPASDRIILPAQEQFASPGRYYATALHELGHWTGHSSRLNRDLTGGSNSEGYAKEELRAEIASLMLGAELGVEHDPGQHAAYVQSWIKALRDDPREIFRAAADAEKIHKHVMSFDLVQMLEEDAEREPGGNAPAVQSEASAPVQQRPARRRAPEPNRSGEMSR